MRILLTLALAAFFVGPAPAQTGAATALETAPVFERIGQIVEELSEITGFEAKRPIPHDVIKREDLKDFLEKRVREEIKPEEIRIEELLLRKFGFIPRDFDLKKTMIDLYTEQAAAFYDFHKKRLFLLESDDALMQEAALSHELAHALADQHYSLDKFLDGAGNNDDGAMARMAVMEGQATWLMSELAVRRMGQSLVDSPMMVEMMVRSVGGSADQFPVFDQAPLYLRESLIFPYTSGLRFQQEVVKRHGKRGFSEIFRNPPATTQQILHPETYFEDEKRPPPKLPRLRNGRRYAKSAEGSMGEFDFAVLLRQYAAEEDVRRIAPSWRTAKYRLLEHKKDDHAVLIHASTWENEEVARDFFERYRTILEGKWERFSVERETADEIAGEGDDGLFVVRIDGSAVYAVEGMRSPDELGRRPKR